MKSPEQIVEDYMAASKRLRRKFKDPKEARAFLLKAGIIVKASENGNGKPHYKLARS